MALEPRGVLVSKWLCHSGTDLRPWSGVGWARTEAGPWEEAERASGGRRHHSPPLQHSTPFS